MADYMNIMTYRVENLYSIAVSTSNLLIVLTSVSTFEHVLSLWLLHFLSDSVFFKKLFKKINVTFLLLILLMSRNSLKNNFIILF